MQQGHQFINKLCSKQAVFRSLQPLTHQRFSYLLNKPRQVGQLQQPPRCHHAAYPSGRLPLDLPPPRTHHLFDKVLISEQVVVVPRPPLLLPAPLLPHPMVGGGEEPQLGWGQPPHAQLLDQPVGQAKVPPLHRCPGYGHHQCQRL